MYNPELQRRKRGVSSEMTGHGKGELQMLHNNVMFLPFVFYILQYIWWVGNKTWTSSFKVWTRSQSDDTQMWYSYTNGQTEWNRNKADLCSGRLWWFFFVYFGGKYQFSCRMCSANIHFTKVNGTDWVKWAFLLHFFNNIHNCMFIFLYSDPPLT